MPCSVRVATADDLDAVVELTAAGRRRLAEWSPRWWRPAPNADEVHRRWLHHLIGAGEPVVRVATAGDEVVACAVSMPQPQQWAVDDVSVRSVDDWADAGVELLLAVTERPALLCAPTSDLARRAACEAAELSHVSSYWIGATRPVEPGPALEPVDERARLPAPPPHTFAGAVDPAAHGALVIGGGTGDALVGSPSLPAPPVYDPGGTVCVVDRVAGDAEELLDLAVRASGARGDVLIAVVAATDDRALRSALTALHFTRTVDVFAWPTNPARRTVRRRR